MAGHRSSSPVTQPVLTEAEVRAILRLLIGLVGVTDIIQGVGYLLGAPASAPSLVMLDDIADIHIWGGVLAACGLALFWRPVRIVGFTIGGLVNVIWAFFTVAVIFDHTATGWGWAPYFALAAAHVIGTWADSKAATRRAQ